jgi:SOS response regulatory protein OraA/RecX
LPKKTKGLQDAALGYLTARMRSADEMESHLVRRGYETEEIDKTMRRRCASLAL